MSKEIRYFLRTGGGREILGRDLFQNPGKSLRRQSELLRSGFAVKPGGERFRYVDRRSAGYGFLTAAHRIQDRVPGVTGAVECSSGEFTSTLSKLRCTLRWATSGFAACFAEGLGRCEEIVEHLFTTEALRPEKKGHSSLCLCASVVEIPIFHSFWAFPWRHPISQPHPCCRKGEALPHSGAAEPQRALDPTP